MFSLPLQITSAQHQQASNKIETILDEHRCPNISLKVHFIYCTDPNPDVSFQLQKLSTESAEQLLCAFKLRLSVTSGHFVSAICFRKRTEYQVILIMALSLVARSFTHSSMLAPGMQVNIDRLVNKHCIIWHFILDCGQDISKCSYRGTTKK